MEFRLQRVPAPEADGNSYHGDSAASHYRRKFTPAILVQLHFQFLSGGFKLCSK